jgi:DNA-binding MarR family transcriptional regulator
MKINHYTEQYAIYGMLFSLSNRIQTIGDKEFSDITMKQHFLVAALELFIEPPSLKQMGELIGCSYQNVKRMAAQLEKKGYLIIRQDKADKRKLLLVQTGKVKQLVEESGEAAIKFMSSLYQGISQEDLKITLETLKKMDQNIGGHIE